MESALSHKARVLIKPKNVLFGVIEVLMTKYSELQTDLLSSSQPAATYSLL